MPMAFSGFSKIQKGEETLSKNIFEGDTRGRLKTGCPWDSLESLCSAWSPCRDRWLQWSVHLNSWAT